MDLYLITWSLYTSCEGREWGKETCLSNLINAEATLNLRHKYEAEDKEKEKKEKWMT